jgi:hypothetical protein
MGHPAALDLLRCLRTSLAGTRVGRLQMAVRDYQPALDIASSRSP